MRRVTALARKELRDILRERSLVLALVTQFFVAAFSGFLTFGLVSLYDPEASSSRPDALLAYVGPGGFDFLVRREPNIDVDRASLEDAWLGFQSGRYRAVIEETYSDAANGTRTITLLLAEDELQTSLLVTQLKSLLDRYERGLREERQARLQQEVLYVDTGAEANPYYGFGMTVLLPLMLLTPVFLAGAITGDSVTQEVRTQTLHLLRASPLSSTEFVLGKLLTPVGLVPLQALVWILLLELNGLPVQNLALLLLVALLYGTILAPAGVAVAFVARTQGQAQAAYALLVLVGLAVSLLAPQDPINLVARVGASSLDGTSYLALLYYAAAAGAALVAAFVLARRRFLQEPA